MHFYAFVNKRNCGLLKSLDTYLRSKVQATLFWSYRSLHTEIRATYYSLMNCPPLFIAQQF